MADKFYPTDLKDEEWRLSEPFLVRNRGRRGKRKHDPRRIVDGCFYVLRGGIPWRMMPHDLPPWEDVYYHLRTWRRKGTWERINQVLRERHPGPPAPADGGGDRQPVGQDHRGRRPARL